MTPKELKNSILQLAIKGKLVEQRLEEGTGQELYQQILAEKHKLIKAGTIKNEKGSFSKFNDDELLFDIPENWCWARFGTIMINRDSERIPLSTEQRLLLDKKFDYYGASGVIDQVDRFIFDKKLLLIGEDGANLLARSTPIAFLAKGKYWVNNHAHVLDCDENLLCLEYMMYFVNAISLAKYVTGTAQPKMNQEKMNSIPVALPPLAEQKRIVAKIEELLPYIDRYEQAWNKLEDFNKRFPTDMQKSILQTAIQGKLVEQRSEEGSGEELYQQILAEKQRLIKAGTIKKVHPLREIAEDEKPFDIPESWKWVRMSDVIDVRDGTHDTPAYIPKGYPLITGKDFYFGEFDLSKTQYISESDYLEISKRSLVEIGDILFSMIGGNIGSMIRITEENYFEMGIKNVALFKQYYQNEIFSVYLLVYLKSQISNIKAISKGGAQAFIPLNLLRNYLLPLPPLAEQKRIDAKLEEILPLCEKLK